MAASNEILSDGLFNMGMIYKDKLEDFPRAEHSFGRLIHDFPDFAQLDEAYYNLFLMLGRMERMADANLYKQQLSSVSRTANMPRHSLIRTSPTTPFMESIWKTRSMPTRTKSIRQGSITG